MKPNKLPNAWKLVERRGPYQCWSWRGGHYNNGYARFNFNQTSVGAHRVIYELANGPIARGLFVMHKCNNKGCVNPEHLTLGTNRKNQLHAAGSGAWPLGASGIRGVGRDKQRNYWIARCYENGKARNLYTGPHKQKAIQARLAWEAQNYVTFKEQKHAT